MEHQGQIEFRSQEPFVSVDVIKDSICELSEIYLLFIVKYGLSLGVLKPMNTELKGDLRSWLIMSCTHQLRLMIANCLTRCVVLHLYANLVIEGS